MKRWWIIALVFVLALSLTSCARRKKLDIQGNYGFSQCNGNLGLFDVYVIMSPGQSGMNNLVIIPYQVDNPGDIISIAVVTSQNLNHRVLQSQVAIDDEVEINAGTITDAELNTYDTVALYSAQPGTTLANANPNKQAVCPLPLIGDNVQ